MKTVPALKGVTYSLKILTAWFKIIQGAQISQPTLDDLITIPFVPFNPIPFPPSSLRPPSSAFEMLLHPLGMQALCLPSRVTSLLSFILSLKIEFSCSPFPLLKQSSCVIPSLSDGGCYARSNISLPSPGTVLDTLYHSCLLSWDLLYFIFKKKFPPPTNYLYSWNQCLLAPIHGPRLEGR